jgi:hypothetical protein
MSCVSLIQDSTVCSTQDSNKRDLGLASFLLVVIARAFHSSGVSKVGSPISSLVLRSGRLGDSGRSLQFWQSACGRVVWTQCGGSPYPDPPRRL